MNEYLILYLTFIFFKTLTDLFFNILEIEQ